MAEQGSGRPKSCNDVTDKAKNKFEDMMPDTIKQLPRLKCFTGCCYYFGVLIAFAVLLGMSIQSNMAVRYISLEPDSSKCEEVKTTVASSYGLDANGYWSTSTKYNVLNAVLVVKLLDFKSSLQVYVDTYAPRLSKALVTANTQYKAGTMSTNLLSFLTKSFKVQKDADDETFKFRINAQADYIFKQESQFGYIFYIPNAASRRRLEAEDGSEDGTSYEDADAGYRSLQLQAASFDEMARTSLNEQLREAKKKGSKVRNVNGQMSRAFRGSPPEAPPRPFAAAAPVEPPRPSRADATDALTPTPDEKRQLAEYMQTEEDYNRELQSSPTPAPTPSPTPSTPAPTPAPTPATSGFNTPAPTPYTTWWWDNPSYSSGNNYQYYSDDGSSLAPGQVATTSDSNYAKSTCSDNDVSYSRYNFTLATPSLTDYMLSISVNNINRDDFTNFLTAKSDGSGFMSSDSTTTTTTSVDLYVDMRSFSLAAAINQGVIGLDEASYIKPVFKGSPLAYYFLDQPNFVGMPSIICNTSSKVCNVPVGQGAMYPIFKHDKELSWYNDTMPNLCSCSRAKQDSTCNDFHHQLLFMYRSGGCFINNKVQDKLLNTSLAHGLNLLQVYLWGSSQVINNYYYEVMEPNCKGKFAVRYSTRLSDNFAKLPPTSLIQDYFKCRYGTSDIITNSFSNAFANSSAVAAGWLPLLVALIVFYLKKRYKMEVETISQDQIDDTLREIAMERITREKAEKKRALSATLASAPEPGIEASVTASTYSTTRTALV